MPPNSFSGESLRPLTQLLVSKKREPLLRNLQPRGPSSKFANCALRLPDFHQCDAFSIVADEGAAVVLLARSSEQVIATEELLFEAAR
jgi:hypothetical protein